MKKSGLICLWSRSGSSRISKTVSPISLIRSLSFRNFLFAFLLYKLFECDALWSDEFVFFLMKVKLSLLMCFYFITFGFSLLFLFESGFLSSFLYLDFDLMGLGSAENWLELSIWLKDDSIRLVLVAIKNSRFNYLV